MSFLAGLLPAIGGLLPGIISTVGNVVGKLGTGDFAGALGEVGKALSGGGGAALSGAAKSIAQGGASDNDFATQQKFDRELEQKRKLADLDYEIESRKRRISRVNDHMPMWYGRGMPRKETHNDFRETISSGAPIEDDYEELEETLKLPPVPRRNTKKPRRPRRY